MPDPARNIRQLLKSFPEQREHLLAQLDRMQAYAGECGCAMGAAFALAAIALLTRVILLHGFDSHPWYVILPGSVGGILLATTLGKLLGIGIARVRLAALNRRLRLHCENGS